MLRILRSTVWVLLLVLSYELFSQTFSSQEERRAYQIIIRLFEDAIYTIAEQEAKAFIRQYPNSEFVAEVALVQARSAMALKKYEEALYIIEQMLPKAGEWQDDYLYWQAQILVAQEQLEKAIRIFQQLLKQYPNSPWRFEVVFRIAENLLKVGHLTECIQFLSVESSPFSEIVKQAPDNEWILRSQLILAEALISVKDLSKAEQLLQSIDKFELSPPLHWYKYFLSIKIKLLTKRFDEALHQFTNIWTVATNWVASTSLAEASMIEGEILTRLGRYNEAAFSYLRCLELPVSIKWREAAVHSIFDLLEYEFEKTPLLEKIDSLLHINPTDPINELIRFRLALTYIKSYQNSFTKQSHLQTKSSLLEQAAKHLEALLKYFPKTNYRAHALALLGWTYQELSQFQLAQKMYSEAIKLLPPSPQLIEAYIGLGDVFLTLGQIEAALTNFCQAATNYMHIKEIPGTVREKAFLQVVLTAAHLNKADLALEFLKQLESLNPTNSLLQTSYIATIEAWINVGNGSTARELATVFRKKFPDSSLIPHIEFLIAKTYELDNLPDKALEVYQSWLNSYTNLLVTYSNLYSQALFAYSRLLLRQGTHPQALNAASRFIDLFPTDPNLPLMYYLMGEYFLKRGETNKALEHFSNSFKLSQKVDNPPLISRSAIMAARSAIGLMGYAQAKGYLEFIITNGPLFKSDSKLPIEDVAYAYIMRGDLVLIEKTNRNPDDLSPFGEALTFYSKAAEHLPYNSFTPIAWGKVGDCQFQLASTDPTRYVLAETAYRKVIDSDAPVAERMKAEVAYAYVLIAEAKLRAERDRPVLFRQALERLVGMVYGKNLRDGEQPDPYWLGVGGILAMELSAELKDIATMKGLAKRLEELLPILKPKIQSTLQRVSPVKPSPTSQD